MEVNNFICYCVIFLIYIILTLFKKKKKNFKYVLNIVLQTFINKRWFISLLATVCGCKK